MDKGICNKLEIPVILALGIITLVVSSFIVVAGASPAGAGSGSGVVAALEAGMTSVDEEMKISTYANVEEEGMLTYTNEEYGFSIEYPEGWTVQKKMGLIFFEPVDEAYSDVNVCTGELPTNMSSEEFGRTQIEYSNKLFSEYQTIEEYNTLINGKEAFVYTYRITVLATGEEEVNFKFKQACIVDNLTVYIVTCGTIASSYDESNKKYFEPMIQSFEIIPRTLGIEIQNFLVTPTKTELGQELNITFDAVNKASVEKTKILYCHYVLTQKKESFVKGEEIGHKIVTLTPGEIEHIKFTYTPSETGTYLIKVEDLLVAVEVVPDTREEEMLTYTNEEYCFSIEYPEGWTVDEGYMGSVVMFFRPIIYGGINVIVAKEELPTRKTAEEYAKAAREIFSEERKIVRTFNDTINGEPVAGQVITFTTGGGIEVEQMHACFVRDTTAYSIVFTATMNTYDEAKEDYFDPMLRSFKFIEEEAGIEIRVFIVTPGIVEVGEEVKIKFEAVNEADVEKTKTFLLHVSTFGTLHQEVIDFKTVTLTPGESVEIEFSFIPKETEEHILSVEDRTWVITVDHDEEARISVKNPPEVLEGENFTATVTMDNASDLSILLFKLNYDPSVVALNKIEKGSNIATSSWSHWYSSQDTGIVTIYAFSDPSGVPVIGPAELARLEFSVVGMAGDKSALDIQGIIANSYMESIQAIWVDAEVTVIPGA